MLIKFWLKIEEISTRAVTSNPRTSISCASQGNPERRETCGRSPQEKRSRLLLMNARNGLKSPGLSFVKRAPRHNDRREIVHGNGRHLR